MAVIASKRKKEDRNSGSMVDDLTNTALKLILYTMDGYANSSSTLVMYTVRAEQYLSLQAVQSLNVLVLGK